MPGPNAKTNKNPLIIFVHGAGGTDRHGFGLYPPIKEAFLKIGIATLSWDKLGVGKSNGHWESQSLSDRADEVLTVINEIKKHAKIDPRNIGLWGISQGGWVSIIAAAKSKDIALILPISTPGIAVAEQEVYRVQKELNILRFSAPEIKEAVDFIIYRVRLAKEDAKFSILDDHQRKMRNKSWFKHVGILTSSQFNFVKRVIDFDPRPYLAKVHQPVMAIWGDLDVLLPAKRSEEIFHEQLKIAKNRDFQTKVFQGADHAILSSKTGTIAEMIKSQKAELLPFAPLYLELMSSWVSKRFKD